MNSEETTHERIAKYASGESSPEEAMQVEAWASESKENELYLANCFKLFNAAISDDNKGLKASVWQSIRAEISAAPRTSSRKIKVWAIGVAASVLLAVIGIGLFNKTSKHSNDGTVLKAGSVPKKVRLQDGTEMTLNPHAKTTIGHDYGLKSRDVSLEGSASFYVIHDSAKPFVVTVGGLHIKDLGTRFSVNQSASDNITVAVEEGSVLVYEDMDNAVSLVAGEQIIYKKAPGSLISFRKRDSVPATKEQKTAKEKTVPSPSNAYNETKTKDNLPINKDSLLNFTLAEVQEVVGASASMTNNNKNTNNGLVKYSRQYKSVVDATVNLFIDIECLATVETAQKSYERLRSQNSDAQSVTGLTAIAAEAFTLTDKVNFYMAILQRQNVIYRVKINKLKPTVSTDALVKILKRKAQAIR